MTDQTEQTEQHPSHSILSEVEAELAKLESLPPELYAWVKDKLAQAKARL